MIALRLAAAGGSAALGWLGADQVSAALGWLGADQVSAAQGPDFLGIAALITAIGGLIGVIGGLFLATRRKPLDPQDVALLALAERLTRDEDPHEQA